MCLWIWNFVRGQWGFSFALHEPVTTVVLPALRNTLLLAAMAELMIVDHRRAHRHLSGASSVTRFRRSSDQLLSHVLLVPYFILAIFLLYFFAIRLQIFPALGAIGTGPDSGSFVDHVYHAFLPAVSIAIASIAVYSRYTRASMLDVSRRDFVRTAYAKGLQEGVVFRKHVFRNGMIPIITSFGLDLGGLAGGAVILEGLFAYQGMGYVTLQAATERDYTVIMATTMIIAFGVMLGNLIADIIYAAVDPRIRYN